MNMAGSLYIHVPFCRAKCAYCDFYSMPVEQGLALRYVDALRAEAQMSARGELGTVFIGGGTPTVLPAGSIRTMLECLPEHAHIIEGAEVTVEANPESLTPALIDELRQAGATRLSVGVQSFDDAMLTVLGRPHTSSRAVHVLKWVASSGLDFSLDLMYSIPEQSLAAWRRTLKTAIGLRPSHISAYELMLEPGTHLERRVMDGELRVPDEGEALAMYHEARTALTLAGYEHYEVSNYALQGKRSRHNMNYWRRGQYFGLGPGAVSFQGGMRTRNLPDVARYCDALEKGRMPPSEQETPSPDEASREFLMLGLRTSGGVELKKASDEYGLSGLESAALSFLDSGVLLSSEGRLLLSDDKGMPVMNTVLVGLFNSLGI